jgi:hypothetical protein
MRPEIALLLALTAIVLVFAAVYVAVFQAPPVHFTSVNVPGPATYNAPACYWENGTGSNGNDRDQFCLWVTLSPGTNIYNLQGKFSHGNVSTTVIIPPLAGTVGQNIGWQAPDGTGSLEFQPAYTVLLFPYVAACTLSNSC